MAVRLHPVPVRRGVGSSHLSGFEALKLCSGLLGNVDVRARMAIAKPMPSGPMCHCNLVKGGGFAGTILAHCAHSQRQIDPLGGLTISPIRA